MTRCAIHFIFQEIFVQAREFNLINNLQNFIFQRTLEAKAKVSVKKKTFTRQFYMPCLGFDNFHEAFLVVNLKVI